MKLSLAPVAVFVPMPAPIKPYVVSGAVQGVRFVERHAGASEALAAATRYLAVGGSVKVREIRS